MTGGEIVMIVFAVLAVVGVSIFVIAATIDNKRISYKDDDRIVKAIMLFRKSVGKVKIHNIVNFSDCVRIYYFVPDIRAKELMWVFQVDENGEWINYQDLGGIGYE